MMKWENKQFLEFPFWGQAPTCHLLTKLMKLAVTLRGYTSKIGPTPIIGLINCRFIADRVNFMDLF